MYTYDLCIIKDQIQPPEIRGGASSFQHLSASVRLILCLRGSLILHLGVMRPVPI